MRDVIYECLQKEPDDFSWMCCSCGMPYFASSFFESSLSLSDIPTTNSFSCLAEDSPGPPQATSSPKVPTPPKSISKPQPNLSTIVVNCRSIVINKASFTNMIESTKPDVVVGTESWLTPEIQNSEIFPPGYNVYRKDRKTGKKADGMKECGGGVFLMVSTRYISIELTELDTDCELVWAQVQLRGLKYLNVGAFYRPDHTDDTYLEQLNTSLERISKSTPHIWLGGDFNLPSIDWETESTMPGGKDPAKSNRLLEIAADNNLTQVQMKPTRDDNNLDLFFTNHPSLVNRSEVIPGFADHDIPILDINLKAHHVTQKPRKVFIKRKADYDSMRAEAKAFTEEFLAQDHSQDSPDVMYEVLTNKIQTLMDAHIPTKMVRGNRDRPWVSDHTKKLIRKRDKIFGKARNGNKKAKDKFKALKHKIQKKIREDYNKYINSIILDDTEAYSAQSKPTNTKKFYSFIKNLKRDSTGVAPLKENGILTSDSTKKADILNRQYQSVFTQDKDIDSQDLPPPERQLPTMPDIQISLEGVTKLLMQLNPSKAAGPDQVPPSTLKEIAQEIAPIVQIIFQRSLDTGTLPKQWLTANIAPVFKKGEKYKASNYRPVSLTCICSKLLEHIVVSHLLDHLDSHNALADEQHGFRHRRSCETQLIQFIEELGKGIQGGGQIDLIIMDFTKAFDKVSHQRLLYKLEGFGVSPQVRKWIEHFLCNRSQRVIVEGCTSGDVSVDSGVPQGTVLGPTLFLLYINDLPEYVQCPVRLFADDCVIYNSIKSIDDTLTLQEDLAKLEEWEQNWKMDFNPSKCFAMNVTRKRKPLVVDYLLKNSVLTNTESSTYLGVTIRKDLKWDDHINRITSKANRTLGLVRRNIKTNNQEIKTTAFNTLVRPVLDYASSVWDPHLQKDIDKVQAVQRRAARFVCNRYHNMSSPSEMLTDLDWEPLIIRRQKIKLCTFYKIHYGLVDIVAPPYIHLAPPRARRSHDLAYFEISTTTAYYRNTFYPSTVTLWNSLPAAVATSPTLLTFKAALGPISL